MTPDQAKQILARLEQDSPAVTRLAELVACAARVDPALLREARLSLLPESDAGLEADLWFGPLVQLRSPEGFVLHAAAAERLRACLAVADPPRYEAAWQLTERLHRHLSPALRLEEEVAYCRHSLSPGSAERARILLRRAIAALASGGRDGLAQWAARALPRLPQALRVSPEAQLLETGARLRMGRAIGGGTRTVSGPLPAGVAALVPAEPPRVPVALALYPELGMLGVGVSQSLPQTELIELPATDPLVLEITPEFGTASPEVETRSLRVELRPGETRWVQVAEAGAEVPELTLRTLLGESYRLRRRPLVLFVYSPRERDWLDRVREALRPLQEALELDLWDDSAVGSGQDWVSAYGRALERAALAIVLVSPDLLASERFREQTADRLTERVATGGLALLPVVVRPARWQQIPPLRDWLALPGDGRALAELNPEAQVSVLGDIVRIVAERLGASPQSTGETKGGPQPDEPDPAALAELIHWLRGQDPAAVLHRDSPQREAVAALQAVLTGAGLTLAVDGHYGPATAQALAGFAQAAGYKTDGEAIDRRLAEGLLRELQQRYIDLLAVGTAEQAGLELREVKAGRGVYLYLYDGERSARFTRHRDGVFITGDRDPVDLMQGNLRYLVERGLSESEVRVATAVAEVQGNFDAVRSGVPDVLSFGCAQWSLDSGGRQAASPLAGLLAGLQRSDEKLFYGFFGRFGLGTEKVDPDGRSGHLSLEGGALDSREALQQLASPVWAFRFWRAAQESPMQAFQLEYLIGYLDVFYRSERYAPGGRPVAKLLGSELGVAMALDRFVTQPGGLTRTLEETLSRSALPDPAQWGGEDQQQFLSAYLDAWRAQDRNAPWPAHLSRLEQLSDSGLLSRQAGSFRWHRGPQEQQFSEA